MKKFTILGLCLAVGLGATAQNSLVKEVERSAKNAEFSDVLKQMEPAFTNPETANQAAPYYIVGKAGLDQYDNSLGRQSLGQQVDELKMAQSLLGGYEYLMKALPFDSLPDAKGKVKPKYSNNIVSSVAGHYSDFQRAGVYFWEAKQFNKAYDAWEVFVTMPNDVRLGKNAPKAFPDSIVQSFIFNQGLAAYNEGDKERALDKFIQAKNCGDAKKTVYDYALSIAIEMNKQDTVLALAQEARPKFGAEDNSYLRYIINYYNTKGDGETALKYVDDAIAENPKDAELYNFKGFLKEYKELNDEATELYKQAAELEPDFALAQYNYGRMLYNKALIIADQTPQSEYAKVRRETLIPLYNQAKEILENAMKNVGDNGDLEDRIERVLENVNYNIGQQ